MGAAGFITSPMVNAQITWKREHSCAKSISSPDARFASEAAARLTGVCTVWINLVPRAWPAARQAIASLLGGLADKEPVVLGLDTLLSAHQQNSICDLSLPNCRQQAAFGHNVIYPRPWERYGVVSAPSSDPLSKFRSIETYLVEAIRRFPCSVGHGSNFPQFTGDKLS